MKKLKDFITEARLSLNSKYWFTGMGTNSYWLQGDVNKGIEDLVVSLFGSAKGSGIGNANTNASVRPNKSMEFQYGFSNSMLSNYFRLNGKPFSRNDLEKIMETKGVQFEDLYVVKFGTGFLQYNEHGEDFAFHPNEKILKSSLREYEEAYDEDFGVDNTVRKIKNT